MTVAKKILIGLGAVAALLALALVALIAFVDVNRFKPDVEQAVQQRLQRTLTIDGDLALTVFPRLGVALPKTSLSERRSSAVFASIDGARVSLALLPLLGGRIEAGTVSLYGLTATLERRADGSTNIDDLLAGSRRAAAKDAKATPGAPAQFEIAGVELVNANLTLRDLATRNTLTATQLNLKTGRLATRSRTPVELSTRFSATQPALQGTLKVRGEADVDLLKNAFGARGLDLNLQATLDQQPLEVNGRAAELLYDGASGALSAGRLEASAQGTAAGTLIESAKIEAPELAWDPAAQRLAVGGLQASARGRLDAGKGDAFEVSMSAPKIEVTRATASGERVSASLKLGGARRLDARLTLEGLAGSAADLRVGKLALAAELLQPLDKERTRRVVAQIASPARASLDARTLSLDRLAGDITMEDPALAQKSVTLPVTAALALDAKSERIDARLSTRFDETTLAAEFVVRGFRPSRLSFEASADKLNLDRYFPPPKPGPGRDGADPKNDPKVDLSALKDLTLSGEARVGQLQARGTKMQNLRVVLRAAGGRLALAPVTASLYGGSINASAFAQADHRLGLDATLTGVNLGPLLKDALDWDLLAGRGNLRLDLTATGTTVGGLKRGLNGTGAVALRDGTVKGVNVAPALRNARAMLRGGQLETRTGSATDQTDFSEMSASFTVKNGIARNDDLDLKSPLLRVAGAGQVDLPAGTLDYTVRATVVDTLKGQDGGELAELRGLTVPVKLSGPFEKIGYTIDWSAVAQEALKARATEQWRQRLPPKAQDVLKGLFGR